MDDPRLSTGQKPARPRWSDARVGGMVATGVLVFLLLFVLTLVLVAG